LEIAFADIAKKLKPKKDIFSNKIHIHPANQGSFLPPFKL